MNKHYTVRLADNTEITRARKDAAIQVGEQSGQSYVVLSPSGLVVAEGSTAEPKPEPKQLDIEKEMEKIRRMLALAESTTHEGERDTANAKAEKLMLRLGISIAELEASGRVEEEKIVRVFNDPYLGGYAPAMVTMANRIALGFGNVTVIQQPVSVPRAGKVAIFIGFESDVAMVRDLVVSLEQQAMTALHRWQKDNHDTRKHLSNHDKFVGSRSFLLGFAATVQKRLEGERAEVRTEASTGAELVLQAKSDKVDAWIGENIPNLRKGRATSQQFSGAGWAGGTKAGREATISRGSVSGTAKAGQLAS